MVVGSEGQEGAKYKVQITDVVEVYGISQVQGIFAVAFPNLDFLRKRLCNGVYVGVLDKGIQY